MKTCPECGELLDHNVCPECDYERDPGDDCDQRLDQMRDDAMFTDAELGKDFGK